MNSRALEALLDEYMQTFFEAKPEIASMLGLHEYDGRVSDLRALAFLERAETLRQFEQKVMALELDPTNKEAIFDKTLLLRTVRQELFEIEEIRAHENNPMSYSWPIEVANYIKRDYAPLPQRVEALVRHLEQIPAVLGHARANLEVALPKVTLETAIDMFEGMTTYIEKDVTDEVIKVEDTTLLDRFKAARDLAILGIKEFSNFLKTRLPQAHMNFAIGEEKYRRMLLFGEMVDISLEKVLEVGERNLAENRRQMEEIAAKYRPGVSIKEVIAEIEHDHPSSEMLVPETIGQLEEIRQYLIDKDIVSVPSEVRCQVRESPPFMRWAFASMDPAGAFETVATEAYYYLTPVEAHWSEQQKEEWLTKFNRATLLDVSIHEAYPGHYLHFLHIQKVKGRFRQLAYSYSFVEGWAHYAEQMMLEENFHSDDPRLHLAQLSEALLRNSRYMVSLKMHTQGMTLEEATRFIMDNALMEETPALSEARRGTFDPGYLNYTLGKLLLLKLREDYKAEKGAAFSLKEFHDRVLAYGAPPVPLLRPLMLEQDNGAIL